MFQFKLCTRQTISFLRCFLRWKTQKFRFNFIGLVFIILCSCQKVNSQTFIRSCQDPVVQNHLIDHGHTYCFHACGYLADPNAQDFSTCTANGNCLCNYPCGSAPPTNPFAADICPPFSSDPQDPDPTALPRCMQTCASMCPGGQGAICGETSPQGSNGNIFVKACTCYCPPQSCTTTTTPSPFSVAIFKSPLKPFFIIKKKLKLVWKVIVVKLFKLSVLVIKLMGVFLLKLLLFGLFYFGFYQWIDWEVQTFLRNSSWILGYLWDLWSSN